MSDSFPPNFPINTLPQTKQSVHPIPPLLTHLNPRQIQRTLTSLHLTHPTYLIPTISAFYHHFWVTYTKPETPDQLQQILASVLNSEDEAKKVLGNTKSDEVKKRLAANTDEAIDKGAFGLPWFVARNEKGEEEGFWGVDHMGQMVDFLGVERPTERGWKALL